MSRPRMLLLDVFGTVLLPRKPVWVQYAEISRGYGLHDLDTDEVKAGMKQAFKELNKEQPLYGKQSGKTPEDWWTQLIERTLSYAHVADSDLQTTLPTLAPDILRRFESSAGYKVASDVLPFLQSWQRLPSPPLLGLCSNSDRRITGALQDHGVFDYISPEHLYTSWDIESSKPEAPIFLTSVQRLGQGKVAPSECLFVGDDYEEDCVGALNAGLQAGLIQRDEKAHPNVSDAQANPKVHTFESLEDILSLFRR